MTDDEIKALMRATDTDGYPSDLRRLVEAVQERDRERWAKAFDSMREATLAAQSGPDNELENVMLRQLAELGFGECARALRAGTRPEDTQ